MSIVNKYENRNIANMPYLIFFIDDTVDNGYYDTIVVMHHEDWDASCAWDLWHTETRADLMDDFAADLERADPKYDTEGFSITFESVDALLDELQSSYPSEYPEMEQDILAFF